MTTIKELYDQFNVPIKDRYNNENISGIDIGDYTFTDMDDNLDTYITEFTNKNNPNIIVRINNDRAIISLLKILNDEEVDVTSWRFGKKVHNVFHRSMFNV